IEPAELFERCRAIRLEPLLVLRNRALDERHTDRIACRLRPLVPAEQPAGDPEDRDECDRSDARTPALVEDDDQRAGGCGHRESDEMDAADGRQSRERRVTLAVPELEPGKSREQPAA